MKFTTIVLSTFLAALSVSAQNATVTATVVSGTAPLTPAQSTEAACLETCPTDDNTCRTNCIPKGDQTNSIADCITTCPKGNGTATDNANYQSCVESCIGGAAASATATATPTASGRGPSGTGSSASGAATGAGSSSGSPAATTGGSGSSSTATSSAATTSKSSAAETVHMGTSLIGVAGLFAALFAL